LWAVDHYEPESGMLNICRVMDPYPGAYCSWIHKDQVLSIVKRRKESVKLSNRKGQKDEIDLLKGLEDWRKDSNELRKGDIVELVSEKDLKGTPLWNIGIRKGTLWEVMFDCRGKDIINVLPINENFRKEVIELLKDIHQEAYTEGTGTNMYTSRFKLYKKERFSQKEKYRTAQYNEAEFWNTEDGKLITSYAKLLNNYYHDMKVHKVEEKEANKKYRKYLNKLVWELRKEPNFYFYDSNEVLKEEIKKRAKEISQRNKELQPVKQREKRKEEKRKLLDDAYGNRNLFSRVKLSNKRNSQKEDIDLLKGLEDWRDSEKDRFQKDDTIVIERFKNRDREILNLVNFFDVKVGDMFKVIYTLAPGIYKTRPLTNFTTIEKLEEIGDRYLTLFESEMDLSLVEKE